ncbi:histidinol-phosphate transaminase [Kribbia dieselivorans]|uniref:histidinol-phosphate transaminase n=1 Tax=Kribbia dieselivorans TaxID=331526 RepID=UPI000838642B|nr:histidinol-phosphate transaminase [Kribbia dieselivorans]
MTESQTQPDETPAVTEVHLRAALDNVPSYVAGKPAVERPGLTVHKLSSNENPYPPLPSVLEVVTRAAGEMNRYPDMNVAALSQAIADEFEVPVGQVACGPGSVGVLAQIIDAFCDAGDEVVFAWRSFEAYPILVALAGATSVMVPVTDQGRHDLPAMAAAVTERTKVVLICTPNNPTGPSVTAPELEEFLAAVPRDVAVVIDEAYVEFVTDEYCPDALTFRRNHPNVIVLRTFSKAYGLAGLRVGYAVAAEPVADALRKTAVPFAVSTMAQLAAIASLTPTAKAELQERVDVLVAERHRVLEALTEQGWDLPDSQANFVWFPVGERAAEFAQFFDEAGLVVRALGTDGVRVSIGEPEANDRVIATAAAWRAER